MSVSRLALRHPAGTTTIVAGDGALAAAAPDLAAWRAGRRLFLVTTPRVARLHPWAVQAIATAAPDTPPAMTVVLEVPDGEAAKTVDEASRLWRDLLSAGGKRDSRVAVLGGGSATDLGGFVASTFLRGVEVAHVPTTLLAQVDAAIGGKTAIDTAEAKNSVGTYHHPRLVVADARFLATLPPAEVRSGLVEAIKMAVLLDADLLATIERVRPRLLAGSLPDLGVVVAASAAVKARVVERDPKDKDERRLLNFGHTLGHAIEAATGYAGLRHGEAVAYGMLFALRLAERRGLPAAVAERLRDLLRTLGLPPLPALAVEDLLGFVARDKKAAEGGVEWVLPRDLCLGEVAARVPLEEVRSELAAFLAAPLA